MSKPLVITIGSIHPMPMDDIREHVRDFEWNMSKYQLRKKIRPVGALEKSIISALFNYFSSDPEQRSDENVRDAALYLWVSFDPDLPQPPATFDWRIIDKIRESQMAATFGLWGLMMDRQVSPKNRPMLDMGVMLAKAAALRQAEAAREAATKGADIVHKENRDMKRQAIEAFRAGSFTSKDEAAEKIAGQIVPMKFRTVRDWLKSVERQSDGSEEP